MINTLPITTKLIQNKDKLVSLAKKLYEEKQLNYTEDRSEIEDVIDEIVYESFDLTPEEIALVEESVK